MPNNRWILAGAWALLWAAGCNMPPAYGAVSAPGPAVIINKWTTEDGLGLPQNSVISMTQTRDGYLWLGTGRGLARFDGNHFKTFDDSDLNSGKIVKLFEDSRTNLWIGTDAAGVVVVSRNGKVSSVPTAKAGDEGPLVTICEDTSGGIWLRMAKGQLYRYWNDKVSLITTNCCGLGAEDSGLVWIGTPEGSMLGLGPISKATAAAIPVPYEVPVGRLDFLLASKQGGYWRLANGFIQKCKADRVQRDFGPYPWNRNTPVLAAAEDREGNLVVGTYGDGVWWFDAAGKAAQVQGLSHSFIYSLVVDREGSLWVGTDGGGLNRVKQQQQVFDVLDGSRGLTIQSVCEDAQGGLWFSINNGGVGYWKDGTLQQFGERQGLTNLYVRAVFVDQKQNVWAGTFGGGLFQLQDGTFRRAPGSEAVNPEISAICEDRRGLLWVGTQGGLACWDGRSWKVFTTGDGLPANAVQAVADDPDGSLWVGTAGGGLGRLRDGRFTAFTRTNGLPSNTISSLHVDGEGVLWVGTSGGLARFHGGKWTRYSKDEGLLNNSVGYLVEDARGYLWMGSTAGLMRADKNALNDFAGGKTNSIFVRAYGQSDGLPSGECTFGSQPAACRTRDGKLWFPTISGLASLNPALLNPNTNPPPVVIESVRVDGQLQNLDSLRAPPPQAVTVPAGKESLEIDFTSLNLSAPKQGRFKYRLENYESAWTRPLGDVRSVRYSMLRPGNYRFEVTACNEDGVWNPVGSTLAVTVVPPFWRTWWFLGATTACLLAIIIGSVHYVSTQKLQRQLESLRQQEALEKERARIARDLHDQLGANLTQVALLGELAESDKDAPQEVQAHAQQICQTALETTRALDEIVWAVNPSNDTLDGLITYICKYAQEYLAVAGVRYRLDVPAQLPAVPISPELRHNVFLAAKEAVTNVVRHARASAAWVRLKLEPASFTLEIADDGRGLAGLDEKAAQSRNGLRNMRKRMEDVGGAFSIGPAPEGGTAVRLTAPIRMP